ncbi:MAG: MoaD/ThiS family protein [Burkholderiales bacterium]|nr:MAG: MoaD/ThiS family protein [Burkholderiales bacterium]
MKITFKLFASLTDYLPPEARRANQLELEYSEAPTVNQVIERFSLPPKLVHLVLINGAYVQPEARASRTLNDGEALAIWPPIAGG